MKRRVLITWVSSMLCAVCVLDCGERSKQDESVGQVSYVKSAAAKKDRKPSLAKQKEELMTDTVGPLVVTVAKTVSSLSLLEEAMLTELHDYLRADATFLDKADAEKIAAVKKEMEDIRIACEELVAKVTNAKKLITKSA